ncbi:protein MOTHER of FT and TFL1 homolog 1-like [Carex rostrata]
MGSNVDPLVVGGVIGEVVDLFVPTTMMDVNFGTKHVNNGCDIKPSLAADPPFVKIGGRPCHLFTLVMTDPDAPSPSEPSMRECLHWLVINIPGGTSPIQGDEVISYVGPKPPLGIHRYTLVLFQQKSRLSTASIELPAKTRETRAEFNTRNFADQNDLGMPVAAAYFNSHKEPNRRRH